MTNIIKNIRIPNTRYRAIKHLFNNKNLYKYFDCTSLSSFIYNVDKGRHW